MTISVIVPTYHRPQQLVECLTAIEHQDRSADHVIVVVRPSDAETLRALKRGGHLKRPNTEVVFVTRSGVVAALNAGLAVCKDEVIALTDDDACPKADWLARIEHWLVANPLLAGVGGRDVMKSRNGALPPPAPVVGKLQWYGRVIGNHHLGVGQPREVDVLKGVNCAFRRCFVEQIGFDGRLRGAGAQAHWELSLCLALKTLGGRLMYDPALVVDHAEADRVHEDRPGSDRPSPYVTYDSSYNETLVVVAHLEWYGKVAYVPWAFLVGTRQAPGLVQAVRLFPSQRSLSCQRTLASMLGKARALRDSFGAGRADRGIA